MAMRMIAAGGRIGALSPRPQTCERGNMNDTRQGRHHAAFWVSSAPGRGGFPPSAPRALSSPTSVSATGFQGPAESARYTAGRETEPPLAAAIAVGA